MEQSNSMSRKISVFFILTKVELLSSKFGIEKKNDYEINTDFKENSIDIETLTKKLKDYNISLINSQILTYSSEDQCYIFIGVYTEKSKSLILNIINNQIKIKYRPIFNAEMVNLNNDYAKVNISKSGRANERTIKEAIMLVTEWKKNKESKTLETSANALGVSKKTLDEYNRQIARGLKFNFDFWYYRDYQIGILRHYNYEKNKLNE